MPCILGLRMVNVHWCRNSNGSLIIFTFGTRKTSWIYFISFIRVIIPLTFRLDLHLRSFSSGSSCIQNTFWSDYFPWMSLQNRANTFLTTQSSTQFGVQYNNREAVDLVSFMPMFPWMSPQCTVRKTCCHTNWVPGEAVKGWCVHHH